VQMSEAETEEISSEEEEETEDEDGSFEPEDNTSASSGSDSEAGKSEDLEDARREALVLKKKTMALKKKMDKKRKHDATPSTTAAVKKMKKSAAAPATAVEKEKEKEIPQAAIEGVEGGEKQFDGKIEDKNDKKNKKEAPRFNDKNCDYDLFSNAPGNVIAKKIKLSNTLMMQCRMIDGMEGKAGSNSFEYAALVFQRKIKDEKAFEFNLPLNLAPNIIEALKLMIQDNPKFFSKPASKN